MTAAKLGKAIANNAALYAAVLGAQSLPWCATAGAWYCEAKVPPLYSNLVTRSADWRPDEIFRGIDETARNEGWEDWSIKDSFRVLDLAPFGFQRLFEASWIYLEAARIADTKQTLRLDYELVKDEAVLAEWRRAWDADEALGGRIFKSAMLEDPNVNFIAGRNGERVVTGCLANRSDDVIGISNVFARDEPLVRWGEMVAFMRATLGASDVVGYERGEDLEQARAIGFETVGSLAVWLKRPKA